jgi:hypothetical protein
MQFVIPYRGLFLFILITFTLCVKAQLPYAEKLVSLNAQQKQAKEVFKLISSQTGVVFSYASGFDDKQLLSVKCNKQPLRFVLSELFKTSNCRYKFKERYVIILCDDKTGTSAKNISGYVYNAIDSSVIKEASIYIRQSRQYAISNTYGRFQLNYSDKGSSVAVSFAKEHYKDTQVVIYNSAKQELLVYLYPKTTVPILPIQPEAIIKKTDSLYPIPTSSYIPVMPSKLAVFFDRFKHGNPNIKNISDTFFTKVSISLVPKLSTNRLLSFNTINNCALNIIAGYSKGVDKFEVGGIANIDNGNVRYVQVAGITNIVSGTVQGVQIGGILNVNGNYTEGLQLAGMLNINKADLSGAQIGGFGNQQNGKVKGLQLGGFYNIARKNEGAQIAGFINITDSLTGLQLAGFINRSNFVKGIQLAPFNFSDSCAGIPIGLFSHVKKGYHKLGIVSDESGFYSLNYGTGVNKFYNIFYFGSNYRNTRIFTTGYGLGSSFSITPKNIIAVELSHHILYSLNQDLASPNQLSKGSIIYERVMGNKFRIGLGPTVNVLVNHAKDSDISSLPLYTFSKQSTNDKLVQFWVGGSVCLKFF